MSKLTETDKTEIRRLYGNNTDGTVTMDTLAVQFDVSKTTISRVINQGDNVNTNVTNRNKSNKKVTKTNPRTEKLTNGAVNQSARIMEELSDIFEGQKAELDDIQKTAADVKRLLNKETNPLVKFELTFELFQKMDMALIGVKDTLSRMASLEKNLILMIDNSTNTTNIIIGGKALEDMWLKYVDPTFRKLGIGEDIIEQAAEIVDVQFKEEE